MSQEIGTWVDIKRRKMNTNNTKKFNKNLYNQYDHVGKKFVAKILRKKHGDDLKIVGDNGFGVDLEFYKDGKKIGTAEVEVRNNWRDNNMFPFDTVNIPYRKKKFFIDGACLYFSINKNLTRCLIIPEKVILESPVQENPNKYVLKGEKFFKVPVEKCENFIYEQK